MLALALLWVLPGFAAERLIERAVDNDDPSAARLAATISPFDPAPLRVAAHLERRHAARRTRSRATRRGPQEWSSWVLVGAARRRRQGARRARLRPRARREPAPHRLRLTASAGVRARSPARARAVPGQAAARVLGRGADGGGAAHAEGARRVELMQALAALEPPAQRDGGGRAAT